ncbi:MAG: hypothetical protein ACI8SZ_002378 [Colwellia sp.]|jgi:hypothetical protein
MYLNYESLRLAEASIFELSGYTTIVPLLDPYQGYPVLSI